jgi:hypothetical protein
MNPTPYELASLAVTMHLAEHGPRVQPDNLSYTDYLPGALGLLRAAKEFLDARERPGRTEPSTSSPL